MAGCGLFLSSSMMPQWGAAAKWAVRCEGREFTGGFDDYFNDYLPIVEMLVPIAALFLLWPFARFAFSLWAPKPEQRSQPVWRLASGSAPEKFWPMLQLFAFTGAAWALWRATGYLGDLGLVPYLSFWIAFAAWFLAAGLISAPRKQRAPEGSDDPAA